MARLLLRDLTPGTTYKIQLRARDGDSASEWSRLFTLSTTSDTTPPDVPAWAVSSAFITAGDTFVATWQDVDRNLDQNKDFDHYEVWFSNGTTSYVFRTTNTSYTLTFAQNKLLWNTPQATVYSQVRSVDQVGNVSAWSSQKSATNAAPSAPGTIGVTALYDSIKVTWSTVTDDDLASYKLQVSTNGTTWSDIYNGTDTMFIHNTTLFTTDHTFRVYAVDKFGTVSSSPTTSGTVRPKSAFAIDTTPPSAPSTFTATGGFDTTNQQSYFDLSWSAVSDSDLDVYVIRYGTDNSHWQYITVPRENTSFRLNVDPSKSYYLGVTARDLSGNLQTTYTTPTPNPTSSTADTSAPSTPQNPAVVSNTMQAQVTATGKKADGVTAMETDVAFYEVYASTTTGFTPAAANMVGTIAVGPAMVGTFDIPTSGGGSTQTWYFKVIAVDRAGNKSGASSQTTATPGLIAATNIVNATITNAQINNVNADQITAGSGFINNLTVKSTLTIGNATTAGAVQSFDYVANTTGWKISTNAAGVSSFEVNGGSISAAALLIQSGANIINPVYSDFESYSDYTTLLTVVQGVVTPTIDNVSAKFGKQNLKLTFGSNTVDPVVYFGQSATDYNIPVTGGQTYILSAYAWVPGANATNVQLRIKWSDGTFSTAVSSTVAASGTAATSTRLSGTVTAPSGATGGVMFIQSSTHTAETVQIDGVQVEVKQAALNTPSTWKPGTSTTIDGGTIKTGKIQSSTSLTINGVSVPTWSIDTNGTTVLGSTLFRGNVIVGGSGEDTSSAAGSTISSLSYSKDADGNITGWIIRSDGTAEFGKGLGPVDGAVIIDGSLNARSIKAGSILAGDITLNPGGAIISNGIHGETVSIDTDGFHVFGADQVAITNASLTSNVATMTTAFAHGFTAGNAVTVQGVGAPYDGDWTLASASGTSFTFAISNADIASAAVAGLALSSTAVAAATGPKLIDFPTNGANPNIISGVLSANTLTVSGGASLRGTSNLENSSTFLIASSIIAPKTAPTLSYKYNDFGLSTQPVGYGLTKGDNGNWFVLTTTTTGSGATTQSYMTIQEFNGTTGAYIADRVSINMNPRVTDLSTVSNPCGLVWNQQTGSASRFHLLYTNVLSSWRGGTTRFEYVITYDNTWTALNTYTVQSDSGNDNGWKSSGLGWDFVNSRLMYVFNDGTNTKFSYLTMTSGSPTATGSFTALPSAGTMTDSSMYIIRCNNLDGGTNDRIILRSRNYNSSDSIRQRFLPYTTTPALQAVEEWPSGYYRATYGMYYDNTAKKVYSLGTGGGILEYQGADSYWTSNSNMTQTMWVGYTFYDSVGTVHETDLSPRASIAMPKRSMVAVGIVPIPYISGQVDLPNQARIYAGIGTTQPTYNGSTATGWFLRNTISAPQVAGIITPNSSPTGNPPVQGANGFAGLGGAATIQSTSGNSFWKGDDSAQFYSLVLKSGADVTASAGNRPPLIIGDYTIGGTINAHMRIDGNELQTMATDSTVGGIIINAGGGAITLGSSTVASQAGITAYASSYNFYTNSNTVPLRFVNGTNTDVRVGTIKSGSGGALAFINANLVAATEGMDASIASLGSGNTIPFHANTLHAISGGFLDDPLSGGGTTGASFNNSGRLIRTSSSLRYKDNVQDLTLDAAKLALNLNSVTFQLKDEIAENGTNAIRYPGFIAEQADTAGMHLWVNYTEDGRPDGFRYAELTAAHNMLIKELYSQIDALEARVAALGG